MPYQVIHFRDLEKLLKKKKMEKEISEALDFIDNAIYGAHNKGELLKQALKDIGWRNNGNLNFFDDRRYQYKGVKNKIGIESNFCFYEFILEGLLRLQIGYDKGKIAAGILLLNSLRSKANPHGNIVQIASRDIENLYPTISLPVTVVLFDLK